MLPTSFTGVTEKIYCLFKTTEFGAGDAPCFKHIDLSGGNAPTIHAEFAALASDQTPEITVKFDGICSFIDPQTSQVYKRINPDKPAQRNTTILPKEKWIQTFEDNYHNLYWINIQEADDPTDSPFFAAVKIREGTITHAKVLERTPTGGQLCWRPIGQLRRTTYELVGPSVLSDRYHSKRIPTMVHTGGRDFEEFEHFFVEHGLFPISIPDKRYMELDYLKQYILDTRIEGLVFHFPSSQGKMRRWKLNRFHLEKPYDGNAYNILPGTPMSSLPSKAFEEGEVSDF
jgi:hypothetical protein